METDIWSEIDAARGNVVLVIDDDEINLLLAKTLLTKTLPCKVITVDNGIEGLDILMRQHVSVVLLDIDMPHMDGFETLERIRAHEGLKSIPVIMLTAAADKDTVLKVAKQGVAGYVRKPFLPDELIGRVQKFISMTTKNLTVLIVDDNEEALAQTKKLIDDNLPYDTMTVESGLDALGIVTREPVPLVLMDAGMDFMDGFRTVEFINANDKLRDVRVILMVETDEEEELAKELSLPILAGYVKKPLRIETLAKKIAQAVGK